MIRKIHGLTRLLCAALVLCLLTVSPAGAEETAPDPDMQALADLAAASVWYCGEMPEGFHRGMYLPDSFAFVVMALGQGSRPALGVTKGMLRDTRAQKAWIEATFMCGGAGTMAMDDLAMEGYTGIRVTAVGEEDGATVVTGLLYTAEAPIYPLNADGKWTDDPAWLGAEARIELVRDEGAPCGWKVRSCVLNEAPEALTGGAVSRGMAGEEDAARFAMGNLVEYVNEAEGFSVEYPAVFAAAELREMPGEGIQALTPDGTAYFHVRPVIGDGPNWDDWLTGLAKTAPEAEITQNPAAGLIVERRTENGRRTVSGYLFDGDGTMCWVMRLDWDEAAYHDMEALADHMINSMSVFALGEG